MQCDANSDMHIRPNVKDNEKSCLDFNLKDTNQSSKAIRKLKYIEILGKKFGLDSICVVKFNDDGLIFGAITEIFLCRNEVHLELQEFYTF